jgi:starch synthase (maltosyl-transferring)
VIVYEPKVLPVENLVGCVANMQRTGWRGNHGGIMTVEGRKRVVVENVQPRVENGRFPAKRVTGEDVVVSADIFADGHDELDAEVLYRKAGDTRWRSVPMDLDGNDRWTGRFRVEEAGEYVFTVEAWMDRFATWQRDLRKRHDAGRDIALELLVGIDLIERAERRSCGADREKLAAFIAKLRSAKDDAGNLSAAWSPELGAIMRRYTDRSRASRLDRELPVRVERRKALFSTWYERFPRSCASEPGRHGTLKDCLRLLPEIARMGFDVFYLPPIHPIGVTSRKGRNNRPLADPGDPGSPWAIGGEAGGHKAVHPDLGTMEDFDALLCGASELGVEIAMDLAFQCSPDHPYVKKHPEWFRMLPDGSVRCAENPPKKYEDILPFDFESEEWQALWEELRSVVLFWIDRGVRIFRVDNPHTKPFAFWEWLIHGIRKDFPDTIFLSEAFTRPRVMARLAKVGFSQSYTYFTWRNSRKEITDYMNELTATDMKEYFRPNFWPNTPDILPEYLQYGGRPAFMIRLVLAATLSSNYGIYGPPFELCEGEALPGKEEYMDSEKYEIRYWDWNREGNLKDFIARVNRIRKENPALQDTFNVRFLESENDSILYFAKWSGHVSETILVVVSLDPFHAQTGRLHVPIRELGLCGGEPYLCHDLLSDEKYIWTGERNVIHLNPPVLPARIFRVRTRLKRETDFDYFM